MPEAGPHPCPAPAHVVAEGPRGVGNASNSNEWTHPARDTAHRARTETEVIWEPPFRPCPGWAGRRRMDTETRSRPESLDESSSSLSDHAGQSADAFNDAFGFRIAVHDSRSDGRPRAIDEEAGTRNVGTTPQRLGQHGCRVQALGRGDPRVEAALGTVHVVPTGTAGPSPSATHPGARDTPRGRPFTWSNQGCVRRYSTR